MLSTRKPQRRIVALILILLAVLLNVLGGISAAPHLQETPTEEATVNVLSQPVAIVGEQEITVSQYRQRTTLERVLLIKQLRSVIQLYKDAGYDSELLRQIITAQEPYMGWYSRLDYAPLLALDTLNKLVEDELVRQEARALEITISEDEVDAKIKAMLGLSADDALEAVETAQDAFFATIGEAADMSDDDIRAYFGALALRDKLRDTAITDVPRTGIFVDSRHILVADEATAEQILAALKNGEDFAELAMTYSLDTGSGALGGELGWTDSGDFVVEFAEAVRNAEIGTYVGPVQTSFGYHIIQVMEREERPLEDYAYQSDVDAAFNEYLLALRERRDADVQVFDLWLDQIVAEPAFSLDAELE